MRSNVSSNKLSILMENNVLSGDGVKECSGQTSGFSGTKVQFAIRSGIATAPPQPNHTKYKTIHNNRRKR